MTYDLIMVVASKDKELIRMTQAAIDSCLADGAEVNVIIVETYQATKYNGVNETIVYTGTFNYNHCLNLGIQKAKNDIVILANNDIFFEKGWSSIGYTMIKYNYLSASALSTDPRQRRFKRGNYAYEGYMIGYHLTGWCIFAQRELFKIIGNLDEITNFWYSDDIYAEQLKHKKIIHALICNVTVLHYGSRTLVKQNRGRKVELTYAEAKKLLRYNPTDIQKEL